MELFRKAIVKDYQHSSNIAKHAPSYQIFIQKLRDFRRSQKLLE